MTPQEFVIIIINQYNNNAGIFSKKINAEELIPQGLDDLNKSFFIFYVLQSDYAMKSQILYKGANRLYLENNIFFTPKFIGNLPESVLTKTLQEYLHPRYINEAVRRYLHNTAILINKYDSDPRKIFENTPCCQDILKRLKEFRGFGPKIGNFFARTMINTFDYVYSDIDTILPPVDVHDVRITYLLGFIGSDQMTQRNINLVKNLWNKACIDTHNSWLVFDKALWLLGSEGKPKSKEDVLNLLK